MGEIRVQRDESGVVTLWLSNPGRLNALSNTMVIGLCEAMARLAADDTCRAIVLRGSDGVFCAGRDLRDLNELRSAEPDAIARMYDYMQRMNEAIYYAPHPVVSVVEKYALGIATMIVSWSDIALAEENALLGYPEVHHGITPYGAVPTMLNTMSEKAMMDLLLTGRKIDALEAMRLGIVTRAVPTDQLMGAYEDILQSLFRGSAAAIRKSKQFVRQCEDLSYRQGIEAATKKAIAGIGTPEIEQGLAAFLNKERAERP